MVVDLGTPPPELQPGEQGLDSSHIDNALVFRFFDFIDYMFLDLEVTSQDLSGLPDRTMIEALEDQAGDLEDTALKWEFPESLYLNYPYGDINCPWHQPPDLGRDLPVFQHNNDLLRIPNTQAALVAEDPDWHKWDFFKSLRQICNAADGHFEKRVIREEFCKQARLVVLHSRPAIQKLEYLQCQVVLAFARKLCKVFSVILTLRI